MNQTQEFENTHKNLRILAEQLALNHFNDVSIDYLPEQYDNLSYKSKLLKIKHKIFSTESLSDPQANVPHRNILVIGAGATFNSFTKIPLAKKAIQDIQKGIIVTEIASGKNSIELDFDYYIKFYRFLHPELPQVFKLDEETLGEEFNNEVINNYLFETIDFALIPFRKELRAMLGRIDDENRKRKNNSSP